MGRQISKSAKLIKFVLKYRDTYRDTDNGSWCNAIKVSARSAK